MSALFLMILGETMAKTEGLNYKKDCILWRFKTEYSQPKTLTKIKR